MRRLLILLTETEKAMCVQESHFPIEKMPGRQTIIAICSMLQLKIAPIRISAITEKLGVQHKEASQLLVSDRPFV
ncbi:MAG: hypothetical protein O7B35_08430 [Deltaproteobacteria bacterium]|nr:hypothetical protein [Deltaproteobacteria bacterium]